MSRYQNRTDNEGDNLQGCVASRISHNWHLPSRAGKNSSHPDRASVVSGSSVRAHSAPAYRHLSDSAARCLGLIGDICKLRHTHCPGKNGAYRTSRGAWVRDQKRVSSCPGEPFHRTTVRLIFRACPSCGSCRRPVPRTPKSRSRTTAKSWASCVRCVRRAGCHGRSAGVSSARRWMRCSRSWTATVSSSICTRFSRVRFRPSSATSTRTGPDPQQPRDPRASPWTDERMRSRRRSRALVESRRHPGRGKHVAGG